MPGDDIAKAFFWRCHSGHEFVAAVRPERCRCGKVLIQRVEGEPYDPTEGAE